MLTIVVEVNAPEAYDAEYGEQRDEDAENGVTDDNDQA